MGEGCFLALKGGCGCLSQSTNVNNAIEALIKRCYVYTVSIDAVLYHRRHSASDRQYLVDVEWR